jgi:hypothetical protein
VSLNIPIGRTQLLSRLSSLPICSLIRAPASTGKRTCALYLADRAGVPRIDQRVFPVSFWADERGRPSEPGFSPSESLQYQEPELSVDMVRQLTAWSRTAPHSAAGKVVIIRLDHMRLDGTSWQASPRCVTALLKTLEEPPTGVRFVLLASGPVAPTIVSRSVAVSAGLLSTEEVAEILFRVSDLDRSSAATAAALSSGRVTPALAASTASVGAKETVLGLLADLASSDAEAAGARAREWTPTTTSLLVRAAHERMTGRFVAFSDVELAALPLPAAMAVLTVVKSTTGARPKLLVGALFSALP